ncbi:MAG: hypothetical protein WDN47_05270 [Candidatus Doudnabacteria bacterium]
MNTQLELMLKVWERLNNEVLQYMRMLDYWIMFLIALLVFLIYASRQEGYRDFIVWAAVTGAITPVWIGRIDVLIHRPVPATIAIEEEINEYLRRDPSGERLREELKLGPRFKTWENYYKPGLKTGVKILVPLDAVALVFLLFLFAHANNRAAQFLADTGWSGVFWWGCWVVFVCGVGIIAAAKPLAE